MDKLHIQDLKTQSKQERKKEQWAIKRKLRELEEKDR
jgi:hypothetical protein